MQGTDREYKFKYTRLAFIDEQIASGSFPSAGSIAKKLECSSRTIQRDIEYMRNFLNAPIEWDAVHRGYYYTEKNFHIKALPINEGEIFALTLAQLLLAQYKNTPIEKSLRGIFEKIEKSLPDNVHFDSLFSSGKVTFISDSLPVISEEVFETVFKALKEHVQLKFCYRPLQKSTYMERLIEPYHAVCQKGSWYIIGKDVMPPKENTTVHPSGDIRIFSLSRIKYPECTGTKFEIPCDFTPDRYFDKETGVWLSDTKPFTVELEFSPEVGTFALDRVWHKNQIIKEKEDGSVYVSFETTQMKELLRFVLGQGHTVKVLEPESLREAVRQELAQMRELYG